MSMKKMLTTLSSTLSAERREFSAISAPDSAGAIGPVSAIQGCSVKILLIVRPLPARYAAAHSEE